MMSPLLSVSAMYWMRETSKAAADAPGIDNGGDIFDLTLLGQYGANFSPGGDVHGGTSIIDPPACSSAIQRL
jgi:hypothetical protein